MLSLKHFLVTWSNKDKCCFNVIVYKLRSELFSWNRILDFVKFLGWLGSLEFFNFLYFLYHTHAIICRSTGTYLNIARTVLSKNDTLAPSDYSKFKIYLRVRINKNVFNCAFRRSASKLPSKTVGFFQFTIISQRCC